MKTALITGASGGIGLELARLFARDSCNLILIARRNDKLTELKNELITKHGIQVHLICKDLAEADAGLDVFNTVLQQKLEVDCLVNNAGFGDYGFFGKSDWQKTAEMIQLNITTLTQLTRLFLPRLVAKKEGWILNVASTAGFLPGPLMSVYYATKAYVLSFSEALANELQGTGVKVSILCPGPTASGFQEAARMSKSRLNKMKVMARAEPVARYGYRSLLKGKLIAIPGFLNKMIPLLVRLLPRKTITAMIRKISAE
jgi:short-subunit dehydrogenase